MLLRPNVGGSWALLVLLALLQEPGPGSAWYKHAASRRYHTVGRASGLLMGVRRSPYMWRRQEGEVSPALTLELDQPGERQEEQGREMGPAEKDVDTEPPYVMATRVLEGLDRDMQPPYSKPNSEKPGMGRAIQGLMSKGDAEKAAMRTPLKYLLALHTPWNPEEIGRMKIQNPLLNRSPEEPGIDRPVPLATRLQEGTGTNKVIRESNRKRTPEETGMETPYDGISIQERSLGAGREEPNQYILALYRKLTPEEIRLDNKMDKLTLRESGAGRVAETTKHYLLALDNKLIPEEPVIDQGTAGTQWYMGAPYSKPATQEQGMASGLVRPFSKWNPEKMYLGRHGPLTKRAPRDLIRYIIAPFTSWASERIDMVSGMRTPERTGKDGYLPSTFTKGTQEETGVNKKGLYPNRKWTQDEMGIETDMQPPYAYHREA